MDEVDEAAAASTIDMLERVIINATNDMNMIRCVDFDLGDTMFLQMR